VIKKIYITPEVNIVICKTMILAGSGETLDFTKEGEYADPNAEIL
jgi:hypothetical protein